MLGDTLDPLDVHVALVDLLARPAWQADAACREYPGHDWLTVDPRRAAGPLAVCAGCATRAECLAFGLATGSVGVFGGEVLDGHGDVPRLRTKAERRRLYSLQRREALKRRAALRCA
jgi:hypothetical protein